VVIGWFLTWWEASNGAGFVVLGDKKICGVENAPEVGQMAASKLSSATV
jgi:hypothetical protein